MNPVFLALLRDSYLRRALVLEVHDLHNLRAQVCLCANRIRPRKRLRKLVHLLPPHLAGVALVGSLAGDGGGLAEVFANGVQQGDPLPLVAEWVDELEAGMRRQPRAFEHAPKRPVHEVSLRASKTLAVGLVAWARPVGVCLGLRKQCTSTIPPCSLYVFHE